MCKTLKEICQSLPPLFSWLWNICKTLIHKNSHNYQIKNNKSKSQDFSKKSDLKQLPSINNPVVS